MDNFDFFRTLLSYICFFLVFYGGTDTLVVPIVQNHNDEYKTMEQESTFGVLMGLNFWLFLFVFFVEFFQSNLHLSTNLNLKFEIN